MLNAMYPVTIQYILIIRGPISCDAHIQVMNANDIHTIPMPAGLNKNGARSKAPVPLSRIFFRLFTMEINSAIANNPKPIGMVKMQCVTIYPNICECVPDYMKIYQDSFCTFYRHFARVGES